MSLNFKSKKCYTLADGKSIQNFVERHLQLLREGIPEICGINSDFECAPVKSNSVYLFIYFKDLLFLARHSGSGL